MHLKRLELNGFKSFAHKSEFVFDVPIIAIVGPNGSGKSNVVEAIRFVLGEQSVKSMRSKTGADLIFKGSREVKKMSRASVAITFDNKDRVFHLHQDDNQKIDVDFDEVTIGREVFADGTNRYLINGTEVRMRDVHELIASVNIGSSGHHIISQGEADRYLNANIKDRRVLIEEALGLKVYQYRIKESERKLERALDNMRETELLRRELAPHLRFLKKQVEKIERGRELRVELEERYQSYLAKEDYLITSIGADIDRDREATQAAYHEVTSFIDSYGDPHSQSELAEEKTLAELQQELNKLEADERDQQKSRSRIDGMLELLKKQAEPQKGETPRSFSYERVSRFVTGLISKIKAISSSDIDTIKAELDTVRADLEGFLQVDTGKQASTTDQSDQVQSLEKERDDIDQTINQILENITSLQDRIQELEFVINQKRSKERETERTYFEYLARKKELDGKRELIATRDSDLGIRVQARGEEIAEAKVLLGLSEISYQPYEGKDGEVSKENQEQLRREIERIKIRLEDIGGGSGVEITNEYQETLERDQFLERELADITTSIDSLNEVIDGLKETLNERFDVGVQKINNEFDRFFKLMFGGGKAELESAVVVKRRRKTDDEPETEEESSEEHGIDIKVQLPRKKVTDLEMLSGGERSLTSIALLFALSQVNPPPFLVLDETDAALDEANSQKYGDMIESLSAYSQLVVVTHNRETMSRAQTLFGVTLGKGDTSTTLSLRLEDAAKYAK